jgi:hypothetical protein
MLLFFLLLLYLCVFGAILHMAEYESYASGDTTGFSSIPTTWYSRYAQPVSVFATFAYVTVGGVSRYFILATMTTVGYGDHYPITLSGQLTTGVCMLCGIFVLGLPIVVSGCSAFLVLIPITVCI